MRLSEDLNGALRPSDGLASGPCTRVVHRVQESAARDSQQSTLAGLPGLGGDLETQQRGCSCTPKENIMTNQGCWAGLAVRVLRG